MPSACSLCRQVVGRNTPSLLCSECSAWFHPKCVDIDKASAAALSMPGASWLCPNCRPKTPPRRSSTSQPQPGGSPPITLESVYSIIQGMRSELRGLTSKYDELVKSVNFCSDRISDFELKMVELTNKTKLIDKLHADNCQLRDSVAELSLRVSDAEQHTRRNNIEIQGIPEKDIENVLSILRKIGDHIGAPVTVTDIDALHRVPHADKANSRPKAIIVKFCSRLKRDNFLAATIKMKRSAPAGSTPGLTIEGVSDRLFVNDHLTPANKKLFAATRAAAREKGYRFTWTRDCKIFVRKSDASRVIVIRCADDILRL